MHRLLNHCEEKGFTLIELMVAIVILGIVIVPLTASIITGLRTTTDAQQRLSESRAVLFTGAFFSNDVQSADTVTIGGTAPCGAGTQVVKFAWADDLSTSNAASYVVQVNSGTRQLVRLFCRGSSLQSSSAVGPELGASNPVAACSPSCNAPRRITLNVTEPSGYSFVLNGTRRAA